MRRAYEHNEISVVLYEYDWLDLFTVEKTKAKLNREEKSILVGWQDVRLIGNVSNFQRTMRVICIAPTIVVRFSIS